ncbi:hypothetical protein SKTS_17700 [Sulfurimicrobium lacus]|uniref:ATP synthase subunit gamma n=1 Tax=Sulfurimicrobium lacus TaxID=2715678 RepID=A0A6F8VB47_9PROT|nr:F0F1 ATP synthase subunit gamma [Sulfurimicrobium lacus]BCB26884.1 hypothetical protein SKTS_17700 [Sulfurimicrobium lacus]
MSRRHELQSRVAGLGEIEGIMVAMKNLALMETLKLTRFLAIQQEAVATIETVASDFMAHYGNASAHDQTVRNAYLVVGSEHGLCGDFNESIAQAVQERLPEADRPPVVAVGHRLAAKLEDYPALAAVIGGPSVAEEVEAVLSAVISQFTLLERALPGGQLLGLVVIYHSSETEDIKMRRLLPLPEPKPLAHHYSHAPLLTLAPDDFLAKLTDHYLYAALHEAFYSSLMVENQQRLEHMDKAIRQLDKRVTECALHINRLRQEEITEEIETIMLSLEALGMSE